MTYKEIEVQASLTGGANYLSGVRDLDGMLYVVYYDQPNTLTKAEYSVDDGLTWTAESWSQSIGYVTGAGGTDPHLFVDPANRIWLGISAYDGTATPHILMRDSAARRWVMMERLSTNLTSPTAISFAMDSTNNTVGWWNIAALFNVSGTVYYTDLEISGDETCDSTGTPTDCKVAFTPGGRCYAAILDSADDKVYVRERLAVPGVLPTWTARDQASTAGHTVSSIEALAIMPGYDYPAVLYRRNVSGTHYLYLSEFQSDGSWSVTRLDDGNDDHHYPGASLQYDKRGSVFAWAPMDHETGGRAEVMHYRIFRGLGSETVYYHHFTSSSAGDIQDTCVLTDHHPCVRDHKPNQLYQGSVGWMYRWPSGAEADQILKFVNYDTYDSAKGNYPTIFASVYGEPMYREEQEELLSRSNVDMSGEGTASLTMPDTPDFEYHESKVFQTSEFRTQLGHRIAVSKFPDGRRYFKLSFKARDKTDLDTIRTFINAREADGTPFLFTLPYDTGTTVSVAVLSETEPYRKIDAGVWAFDVELEETL